MMWVEVRVREAAARFEEAEAEPRPTCTVEEAARRTIDPNMVVTEVW